MPSVCAEGCTYSRAIGQPRPRLCVRCGEAEPPAWNAEMGAARRRRYLAACHAMQSGVAADHIRGSQDGTPKHLRVGINVAQTDLASLAALLVRKGVITQEELDEALADGMEAEARRYEEHLGVSLK